MEIKELGHIVLYVRDLEASRRFYGEILGWKQIPTPHGKVGRAAFSSGRTHHELYLIEVGPNAASLPPGRRVGMYHFGLKVGETDEELRDVAQHLDHHGVTIAGGTDHGVTHSLYIEDPDGHEIELYIDVQPERWRTIPPCSTRQPSRCGSETDAKGSRRAQLLVSPLHRNDTGIPRSGGAPCW